MAENAFIWSITAASNGAADAAVPFPENMLPGAVNNSARGLMAGVARFLADINGTITTGGGSNIYTVTSNSGHTALTNGILIAAKASFTNTAAASLNLNAYGAKNIRVFTGGAEAAVAAGQIISGGRYHFSYDAAADSAAGGWILQDPSPDPSKILSTGSIKIWTGDSASLETGWLWCNGAAVSRTTYAALFTLISTTFGTGDGSTTFNVPDLRGRAPFGDDDMGGVTAAGRITNAGSGIVGTTRGSSGGVESVVLDTTMIPSHTHTGTTATEGSHTHTGTTGTESAQHSHSGTTNPEIQTHTHGFTFSAGNYDNAGITAAVGTIAQSGLGLGIQTSTQTATHDHTYSTNVESATHTHSFTSAAGTAHSHTFTSAATGGGALHTNMPPALIVNYVIKF